jgi:hypothetical protein
VLFVGQQPALALDPAAMAHQLAVELITRWQGTTMQIGFDPLARPTARTADGRPIARAMSP